MNTWKESVSQVVVSAVTPSQSDREAKLLEQLDLRMDYLSAEQKIQLTKLITRYMDVFALNSQELGTTIV